MIAFLSTYRGRCSNCRLPSGHRYGKMAVPGISLDLNWRNIWEAHPMHRCVVRDSHGHLMLKEYGLYIMQCESNHNKPFTKQFMAEFPNMSSELLRILRPTRWYNSFFFLVHFQVFRNVGHPLAHINKAHVALVTVSAY